VLRNFPGLYTCVILFLFITATGCTKIDTTTLGSELIPAVDNVSTFADTLDIIGTQGTFDESATRVAIGDLHALGAITNDPVFGKTQAEVFLELKPAFYPFYFGAAGDLIDNAVNDSTGFDSVVLCLSVKSYYGDTLTTTPHKFQVYTIKNSNTDFSDSSYLLNYRPDGGEYGTRIDSGITLVDPTKLGDTVHYPGSAALTVTNQIRIKLTEDFMNALIADRDTAAAGNGIYKNDANFRSFLKGFAILPDPSANPNGLFYGNITDATTRLEIHFRKKSTAGVVDTSFSSFYFFPRLDTAIGRSPHANYLQRDSAGSELVSRQPDALYILSSPGTYANLRIPALDTFSNSIIHRAEIILEQVPSSDPSIAAIDKVLIPPSYMYLDLIDSASTVHPFKPVYHDLTTTGFYDPDNSAFFFPAQGINFNYFGGFLRSKTGPSGDPLFYYTFNVSRHVQNLITKDGTNYKFRLYAPFELNYYGKKIAFNNNRAAGRIKIGNGNNPGYKLRMRILYSKI
jgi:Domain of unknown function (DUF4270)